MTLESDEPEGGVTVEGVKYITPPTVKSPVISTPSGRCLSDVNRQDVATVARNPATNACKEDANSLPRR